MRDVSRLFDSATSNACVERTSIQGEVDPTEGNASNRPVVFIGGLRSRCTLFLYGDARSVRNRMPKSSAPQAVKQEGGGKSGCVRHRGSL